MEKRFRKTTISREFFSRAFRLIIVFIKDGVIELTMGLWLCLLQVIQSIKLFSNTALLLCIIFDENFSSIIRNLSNEYEWQVLLKIVLRYVRSIVNLGIYGLHLKKNLL